MRGLVIFIFLFVSLIGRSQTNLFNNPSFDNPGPINPDTTWANLYPGSTDWYNVYNAPIPNGYWGVPINGGGYQWPKSGTGYFGIANYYIIPDSNFYFVEYFKTKPSSVLKKDVCYYSGLHFVNANMSKLFCNRLGIHFSDSLLVKPLPAVQYPYFHKPQVALDTTKFYTDTVNWMVLQGVFKAKGGERHAYFGNFYPASQSPLMPKTAVTVTNNTGSFYYNDTMYSYVYIDDVFLYEIPSALSKPDTSICIGQSLNIGLNSDTTNATYAWYPATGLSCTNCPNPVASPLNNISYTLTKNVQGCITQAKTTLTINPRPNAAFSSNTHSACISSNTFVVKGEPPGGVFTGGNVSDSLFIPVSAGTYTLSYIYTDGNSCKDTSAIKTITVYPLPQKPHIIEKDSMLCVSKAQATITASPSGGVFSGEQMKGNVFKVNIPGTYQVYYQVADQHLCNNGDTLNIKVSDCAKGMFSIPNVFSPNYDGANDVWKVVLPYGVTFIKIEIYNRWGTLVYQRDNANINQITWDGYIESGIACDAGTYFYILQTQKENQPSEENKGTITLVR